MLRTVTAPPRQKESGYMTAGRCRPGCGIGSAGLAAAVRLLACRGAGAAGRTGAELVEVGTSASSGTQGGRSCRVVRRVRQPGCGCAAWPAGPAVGTSRGWRCWSGGSRACLLVLVAGAQQPAAGRRAADRAGRRLLCGRAEWGQQGAEDGGNRVFTAHSSFGNASLSGTSSHWPESIPQGPGVFIAPGPCP